LLQYKCIFYVYLIYFSDHECSEQCSGFSIMCILIYKYAYCWKTLGWSYLGRKISKYVSVCHLAEPLSDNGITRSCAWGDVIKENIVVALAHLTSLVWPSLILKYSHLFYICIKFYYIHNRCLQYLNIVKIVMPLTDDRVNIMITDPRKFESSSLSRREESTPAATIFSFITSPYELWLMHILFILNFEMRYKCAFYNIKCFFFFNLTLFLD